MFYYDKMMRECYFKTFEIFPRISAMVVILR